MHILLTDVLVCPRCGPQFGLILLADRIQNRRVLDGALGCANCRERYPVRDGFADLRPGGGAPVASQGSEAGAGAGDAYRIAALLGVTDGPGFVLLLGPLAELAGAVRGVVEKGGVEVVGAGAGVEDGGEVAGVSRIAVGARLPLTDRSARGVAVAGDSPLLEEAARVVAPGGRVVVAGSPAAAAGRLAAAGLERLAEDEDTLVAVRRNV